jgi:hypothetical protein
MTTERFTQEQFETALPAVPFTTQWVKGELVYYLPVYFTRPDGNLPTNKRIVVRSSIDRTGRAADSGQDSIRHWVEYNMQNGLPGGIWKPLAKTGKAWTTRVPGWGERLTEALRELWQIALDDSAKFMKKGANGNGSAKSTTSNVSETGAGKLALSGQDSGDSSIHNLQQNLGEATNRDGDSGSSGAGRDLPVLPGDSGSAPEPADVLSFLGEPSAVQLPVDDDGRDADGNDASAVGPDDSAPVATTGQGSADVRTAAVASFFALNSHQQAVVDAL